MPLRFIIRPLRSAAPAPLLALALGCGGAEPPRADLRAVEVGGRTYWMPAQVMSAHPGVRDAYLFALAHPEVLRYMPCYCGCEEVGHGSNVDCFIREVGADGVVRIDEMGFG
jgi:hypothetical protein